MFLHLYSMIMLTVSASLTIRISILTILHCKIIFIIKSTVTNTLHAHLSDVCNSHCNDRKQSSFLAHIWSTYSYCSGCRLLYSTHPSFQLASCNFGSDIFWFHYLSSIFKMLHFRPTWPPSMLVQDGSSICISHNKTAGTRRSWSSPWWGSLFVCSQRCSSWKLFLRFFPRTDLMTYYLPWSMNQAPSAHSDQSLPFRPGIEGTLSGTLIYLQLSRLLYPAGSSSRIYDHIVEVDMVWMAISSKFHKHLHLAYLQVCWLTRLNAWDS